VILDTSGNIYGTTASGGPNNLGTVFGLVPNGDGMPSCADGSDARSGGPR
jgi:uncharacterized repeat protein (TIGR03803 family)